MGNMFLLLILCGSCLVEGLPWMEAKIEKQDAKIERQEAKIERLDAIINELMETKTDKTAEASRDKELFSATGDKAMRDLPYIMMCAFKRRWYDIGIIDYDELTLDYTNCDKPGGGCSSMDVASGTFTTDTGGIFTITFSGEADLTEYSGISLELLHNGSPLKEGHSSSSCNGGCGGMSEMLSRTVVSNFLSLLMPQMFVKTKTKFLGLTPIPRLKTSLISSCLFTDPYQNLFSFVFFPSPSF